MQAALAQRLALVKPTRVRGPEALPRPSMLFCGSANPPGRVCSGRGALQGARPQPWLPPVLPPDLQGARKQVTRAAVEFYGPDRGEQQPGEPRRAAV